MSWKSSNDYRLQPTHLNRSSTCCYYYLNPSEFYAVPTSFVRTDEQISSKAEVERKLYGRNQEHMSSPSTKQLHQTTTTIPTIDDHRRTKMHRHKSQNKNQDGSFNIQLFRDEFVQVFWGLETINEKQQLPMFSIINDYCDVLRKHSNIITNAELTDLLDKLTPTVNNLNSNNHQDQLPILLYILNALLCVSPSTLASASKHPFCSICQTSLINILRQWHRRTTLTDTECFIFRFITKLFGIFTENINFIPEWLSNPTLLQTIASCLTDTASLQTFLKDKNKYHFKYFSRLIDAYTVYQQYLDQNNLTNKDILVHLLDPIVHCLTSSHFIDTFTSLQPDTTSMTTTQKFFLLKCPAFLTSYYGSRLEQTMDELLSIMLPHYVTILDKFLPSLKHWERPMIRSIQQLFKIINHGANQFTTNAQHISHHLALIDHLLRLINEPIIYDNLRGSLSNSETILMNTAITLLVNMLNEPTVLAHIKQSHVASVFLRLTSCKYEPLVFNVYTLLAYTTHEEDLKTMENSDRLLVTIIQSLKKTLDEKPERSTQIEQLLETLKGLVQHDQIKDEIVKQDALPFLLECANKLTNRALVLLFEILWCLTFSEDVAQVLRTSSDFLQKIQIIAKDNNNNEPLKKAADGLVWKLIQEPAFLEKIAKQKEQEEQEREAEEEILTKSKLGIGADEKAQAVGATKRGSMTLNERFYRYDIMISYCHADKELTYKIHKFLLDQGFKVWIDLDNMYGPAMSAMADAVENSEFVIMCMSDAYKQSTYCQAEAEYAFKCKRCLIPLIMRKGYKPDGWLGFMIGSRMYIDYGRYDFDIACEKIINEISLQRGQIKSTILIDPLEHVQPVKTVPKAEKPRVEKNLLSSVFKAGQAKLEFLRKPINQWVNSEVLDFLSVHHLNQLKPLCDEMNGRALIQLYKICTTNRLQAYSVLKDELKSVHKIEISISIYSRFLTVIEDAVNTPQRSPQPREPLFIENPAMLAASTPFIPASDPNAFYDFSIVTDKSPLEILKMVEHFSSHLQALDSLRHQGVNIRQM